MTHNTGTRLPARHIYRRTKACLAKEFGACAGRNEDDILRATPHIWGLLSVRPMRTLLALIFGFFSILSYAQTPSALASATGYGSSEGTQFGFKLTKMGRPINAASLSAGLSMHQQEPLLRQAQSTGKKSGA